MFRRFFRSKPFRYLLVGGWNTVFGYASGVFLYTKFSDQWPFALIGIMANGLAISMSFVTYKLFVFRTRGRWIQEYFKSYLVYGFSGILGIGLMWLLVRHFDVPIWLAQALVMVLTIAGTYFGHSKVTFKVKATSEP